MKKYIIEVEETKAETLVNLLAQISVKVGNYKPLEEEKRHVKIKDYDGNFNFLQLTEAQFNLLQWLYENDCFADWEEVNPDNIFEEI